MDYKKIFNKHLKNLHKYPELEFFFKTQTRYLILLLACVDYESEKKIIKNFKYYYNNIPSKISSQININNQIDLAIASGYLIKKKSIFDKRATVVTVKNNIKELKKVDYIYKYSLFLQKKLFSNGTHFLKTHSSNFNINEHVFTNHEITSCALYIVRDPRNVLLSYSDYQNKPVNLVYQEMTEEIIQRQKYKNDWYPICHMGSWKSNFNSWKKAQVSFPVKIIKYEDLVSNTYEVFFDILNFLNRFANIDINILKMNSVIKRTEFNNLKKLEDDGFFNEMNDFKKDNKFFKLGKESNWKNSLMESDYANSISNFFQNEIASLGY